MADSILEQIAQWHLAMINSITVANGYQQTLVGTRSGEAVLDGDTARDLSALSVLSGAEDAVTMDDETLDDVNPTSTWWQQFDTFVYVIGRGTTALAVDNRITRIVADIQKRIGVELAAQAATDGPYCGGLAKAIELLPWQIIGFDDAHCALAIVPVRIKYRVLTRDPYSQP